MGGSLQEMSKANPYVYAGDNPVNATDPSGAFSCVGSWIMFYVALIGVILAVFITIVSFGTLAFWAFTSFAAMTWAFDAVSTACDNKPLF